jgi:hypothetical protein
VIQNKLVIDVLVPALAPSWFKIIPHPEMPLFIFNELRYWVNPWADLNGPKFSNS